MHFFPLSHALINVIIILIMRTKQMLLLLRICMHIMKTHWCNEFLIKKKLFGKTFKLNFLLLHSYYFCTPLTSVLLFFIIQVAICWCGSGKVKINKISLPSLQQTVAKCWYSTRENRDSPTPHEISRRELMIQKLCSKFQSFMMDLPHKKAFYFLLSSVSTP